MYTHLFILKKYECESRDTKLGPEEITKRCSGVGETH